MPGEPETPVELPAPSGPTPEHRRRGLLFVGLAAAGVGFTITLQLGLNSNFVAQEMNLSGLQQGLLEMFRESCGIFALAVLAILSGLAEPLVGAGVLVLFGLGMASYTFVPTFPWLVAASLVWSQGFHVWVPLPQSMTLALAEPDRKGHRLGQVQAAGAIGSGAGLVVALALSWMKVPIRPLYLLAGGAAILAAGACLGVPRKIRTPGPRLVFRRRYGLYYLLSFLEGWRKQISIAFAGFLLVKQYGTPLQTMLLLWIAIQAIGWAASPHVGRLIDRVGERRILVFYFACLTAFFVGYAFVPVRWVLQAIFIVDGAMFVLAMSLTTYVDRIVPPQERTATLSMGVAVNHVAAVAMPLVGGLLWKYAGYRWAFAIGAVAAALSILAALAVPRHVPAPRTTVRERD